MCLSTVYRHKVDEANIIMERVAKIECEGDHILLTDLLERTKTVYGTLNMASLTDGYAVIAEKEQSICD